VEAQFLRHDLADPLRSFGLEERGLHFVHPRVPHTREPAQVQMLRLLEDVLEFVSDEFGEQRVARRHVNLGEQGAAPVGDDREGAARTRDVHVQPHAHLHVWRVGNPIALRAERRRLRVELRHHRHQVVRHFEIRRQDRVRFHERA
jgi:hypothetical protein